MLVPMLLVFLFWRYFPMYELLSCFKIKDSQLPVADQLYAGFKYFKDIFFGADLSPKFWSAFRNTFVLSFYGLLFGFPMPIILALMLNEIRFPRFKKVTQTVLYLPHFLSWVIIGSVSLSLFKTETGLINITLQKLGLIEEGIQFITEAGNWSITYLLLNVWQTMGWGTIIYLAAITSINGELYEAAMIDGANRWQQTFHISLPSLVPLISIQLIMGVGSTFSTGLDLFYQIPRNVPLLYETTDVIATYIYRGLTGANYEMSTALGLMQSVAGLFMVILANSVVRKISPENSMF
jgi:putative aldouronate transport system permease protein